jgi:hypothetical protein
MPPDADTRDEPTMEEILFEGQLVRVWRQHCIDADTKENGKYAYYYEYDWFEFSLGPTKLCGRAYTDLPEEASLLRIEVDGARCFLTPTVLRSVLARAAVDYFRRAGKTELSWLDPWNDVDGYSTIPP